MTTSPLLLSFVLLGAEPPGPTLSRSAQIESINRKASGVGIGYDNGLFGQSFGQGLKIDVPFGRRIGRYFGMRLRGIYVQPLPGSPGYDPVVDAGLELFGRGPVLGGILRIYGGGGAWYGIRPNPSSQGSSWTIGGGGHFGLEAFAAPRVAVTIEVGGQSGGHALGLDSGASVMAGLMVYLGDLRRR